MPPLVRKIEPGDVIGRCRTIRELGRGGVGTVYLATHQTLQIEVALKVMSPSLSLDNPALAERFIREGQLAARIRHPNVIAVMDAAHDESTGLYYIVMEYIGGGSLSWHLRHGPLTEAKTLAIVTGIAQALAVAEENSVVHRDIKPDNIMLDLKGTPKLADLGLAKQSMDTRTSITLGGSFMGTPAYMSPEQARDAKIADTRDDIYSLGATFYECLTGQPPFQGETPYNIMSELLTKPSPKPRALRPDISSAADLICRKMMAKNRNLRYADARSLLQDLQICTAFGDAGLDRLEAANFDSDSISVSEQALAFGVETSIDGVAMLPESGDSTVLLPRPPVGSLVAPRQTDFGVFGAAAALVALVTAATLVLAWLGPQRPSPVVTKVVAAVAPHAPVEKPRPVTPAPPKEPTPQPVTPPRATPVEPPVVVQTPVVTPVIPVPAEPTVAPTNAVPAVPAAPSEAVPASPALPDSAFTARGIAESSLPPKLISPTGHADLLKVIGKRDETPETTPGTWVFYFYDKEAAGHARIVTVNNHKVTKSGEDLVDSLSPFREQDILPEDKLLTDSMQALEIAQSLIPSVVVSSSEFALGQQKNSVPMWKVTLWTKKDKEEKKIGDATIVSENGFPISRNLKP